MTLRCSSPKHKSHKMEFETVIGIETHVQVGSKTKLFCRCDNDSYNKPPNINVCPICMGYPGMLPITNKKAVHDTIKAALALNLDINHFSKFDRKHYFYPDLPMGFQISQYDEPISENGEIEIEVNGEKKKIRINRLHLENDAGKLVHVAGGSLCDYNRAGTPLMEIVSEPDMRTLEEASSYVREIQKIMRYVGVSTCDMEKGMMRFDLNISLMPKGSDKFGEKVEIKNINSFRSLERAIEFEIKRQTKALTNNEKIIQETRGWDENKGATISQRSKENAADYRYFPEPDIPPLVIEQDFIDKIKSELPELPSVKKDRFIEEYNLLDDDARILTSELELANYFEETVSKCDDPKRACSYINSVLLKFLNEDHISISESKVSTDHLAEVIKLVNSGQISNTQAKNIVIEEIYNTGKEPKTIIEEKALKQISDTGAIEEIVKKVIEANPGPIEDFKNGKDKALGFIVGQVMKESRGQANPQIVNEIIRKLI